MDKNLIAMRIRYYRQLARISQEVLAEKVGVSDVYIRKLEAGARTPSLEIILLLADALDTTPNHLLLPSSDLARIRNANSGVLELLADCSPTEFSVLYENMSVLKRLLRNYIRNQ